MENKMKNTLVETNLSMKDFTRYFNERRLDRLYFPNGECKIPNGAWTENASVFNFFVNLNDLYKLVCGWRVNKTSVPLADIIAVIAFGSAVRIPGIKPVSHHKYLFFGPMVTTMKEEYIQPKDADFLVITVQNLIREEILEPISVKTYDEGTWIKKGGIHLVNRGISQFMEGLRAKDTISISALQEGVPIFFDERFTGIDIEQTTSRKIFWDEDGEGYLFGRIKNGC